MLIDRSSVDVDFARELFDEGVRDLQSSIVAAEQNPANSSLLLSEALRLVACGCVVDSNSSHITQAIRVAAIAAASLFATVDATGELSKALDGKGYAFHKSAPDESTASVGTWITAFYTNVLVGNLDVVAALSRSTALTWASTSSTTSPEYLREYAGSLQDYGRGQQSSLNLALSAVRNSDPKRPDIHDSNWALYLHVPQIEVLINVITEDSKFGESIFKAVSLHKKYWSKKSRRRDYEGFVAIELSALAAIGCQRGLSHDVSSPYLIPVIRD